MSNEWQKQKEVLLDGLTDKRREITEVLLENQRKAVLTEQMSASGTGTANLARFDKIAMPLVRRVVPATVAIDLVGNQPMNAPVGIVQTLRVRYSETVKNGAGDEDVVTAGDEASGVNVYQKYSLLASGEAYDAPDARSAYEQTLALESQIGRQMNLDIVKKSIEAKTRKLHAKWSIEADQDSKALYGIDLESELVAALSDEIIRELDRELLDRLSNLAGTVKSFDFANADGRYASEKFTALAIGVSDLSNQIAVKTKRGGATWMVVTPNVLTALRHANNGSFTPATGDIKAYSSLFAGTYNGNIRVYVDLYGSGDTMLLGYKGSSELDTGFVYSPYIPLMKSDVLINPETGNPQVSLMTRYALTEFTDTADSLGNSADYYARANIANLRLGFTA